jgi:hypothetical protein
MPEIIIKINSQKLEFFNNLSFSTQINAISSSLSFDTFLDIQTYEFAKIEVLRNNFLMFTGKVFSKTLPNEPIPKPFNYKCYSLTGILEDSTIPISKYPIQTQNKTLKEIIENICNMFDITLKVDISANADVNKIYEFQDQSPQTKASEIINTLCSQNNLIVSHNAKGELIITKKIGTQSQFLPQIITSKKSYNYRKFYHDYVTLGQQSIGNDTIKQAVSRFSLIDENRNITTVQNNGDSGITQKQADAFKNDSYKSNTFDLNFHNEFIDVGKIFIINNVKSISNAMTYNYKAGSETCSVSMLNYKVYDR